MRWCCEDDHYYCWMMMMAAMNPNCTTPNKIIPSFIWQSASAELHRLLLLNLLFPAAPESLWNSSPASFNSPSAGCWSNSAWLHGRENVRVKGRVVQDREEEGEETGVLWKWSFNGIFAQRPLKINQNQLTFLPCWWSLSPSANYISLHSPP